jgi:hypothetical protein
MTVQYQYYEDVSVNTARVYVWIADTNHTDL